MAAAASQAYTYQLMPGWVAQFSTYGITESSALMTIFQSLWQTTLAWTHLHSLLFHPCR